MIRGDLITLYRAWNKFPVSKDPRKMMVVDHFFKGECGLVIRVTSANVKFMTPRGIVGWLWRPRVELIQVETQVESEG